MADDTERKDREHIISENASWEEMLEQFGDPDDTPSEASSGAPSDASRSDEAPPEDTPSAEPAGGEGEPADAVNGEKRAGGGETVAAEAHEEEVQKRTKKHRKELSELPGEDAAPPADPAKELEKAKQELTIKEDKLIRMVAEFENYKKRTRREWELHQKRANAELIKDILGILDDFERAFEASEDTDDHFKSGMWLIYNGLLDVLGRVGLTEIEAVNRPFDPQFHEALGEMESDDVEDGFVAQVVQKGYILRDQLLRPAKVIVAKARDS